MKAADVRPGVVYAYGQGTYDSYDAVIVTAAGDPAAHRLVGSGDTAYPAVRVPYRAITPETIQALRDGDWVKLMNAATVTTVTHRLIRGDWDRITAERDARRASIAAAQANAQALRDEEEGRLIERWNDTADRLAALGIQVVPGGGGYDEDYTVFTLDQNAADRLIERLRTAL